MPAPAANAPRFSHVTMFPYRKYVIMFRPKNQDIPGCFPDFIETHVAPENDQLSQAGLRQEAT
jgi:hypothetical protein